MEAPEPHPVHQAHGSHSWLDIVLAGSAMFVSVVSLFIGIQHGRTMEKMAEANTRMVEANSWPFVEYDSHNVDEQGNAKIRFVLTNQGIGPARVETVELSWNGRPMSSPWALLEACCGATAPEGRFSLGNAAPNIIRAGEHEDFFAMSLTPDKPQLFEQLNTERGRVTARVCYCSVFDECWVSTGLATRADRVSSCPVPATPFRTDVAMPKRP